MMVRQRIITVILGLTMFGGLAVLENGMVAARPQQPEAQDTSSIYMLAGEFRTVFANLLWIKADQYHHEYARNNKNWSQNVELIGLLEMITALDPSFVEAYAISATIYSRGKQDNDKAMNRLKQGIRHNPKAWVLHKDAAIIYARHLNSIDRAEHHARLALQHCDDEFYVASLKRMLKTLDEMEREQQENRKD